MTKPLSSPSPFAQALKSLLDDTNLFDRSGWTTFLGADAKEIESWLADQSLPRPTHLLMAMEAMKSLDVNLEPVVQFKAMAHRRATGVSPLGAQMLPTVTDYMSRPIITELASALAKLTPNMRGEALLLLYPE